jgi:hypothetical protein
MNFDETLIRLYQEMAEKAVDARTRALFQDLVNLEQQEQISVSRAAMSLADMWAIPCCWVIFGYGQPFFSKR